MRPYGSPEQLEFRRKRAVALLEQGVKAGLKVYHVAAEKCTTRVVS